MPGLRQERGPKDEQILKLLGRSDYTPANVPELLRRLGLPRVEVLEYPLDGWEFAGARIEVEGGPVFEAVAYGGASGTEADGLFGELVDCGDGTADAYAGVDVRGKIALVEMDLSALNWPGTALLEAAHQGAIGVVCWPSNHYAMMPGALHTHDLQVDSPVPMLNVSREDGRRLRSFGAARLFSSAPVKVAPAWSSITSRWSWTPTASRAPARWPTQRIPSAPWRRSVTSLTSRGRGRAAR
jgi:hypothetical protein